MIAVVSAFYIERREAKRYKILAELKELTKTLRKLIDGMPIPVLISEPTILFQNGQAEEELGNSREQVKRELESTIKELKERVE